jgi:hypothetical protein
MSATRPLLAAESSFRPGIWHAVIPLCLLIPAAWLGSMTGELPVPKGLEGFLGRASMLACIPVLAYGIGRFLRRTGIVLALACVAYAYYLCCVLPYARLYHVVQPLPSPYYVKMALWVIFLGLCLVAGSGAPRRT